MLTIKRETRSVFTIDGDYRKWRYFTENGALRRLALRKLAKKHPIECYVDDEFYNKTYESDISYQRRMAIVDRYARMWKGRVKRA
jgi:hypothetical protein